MKSPTRCFMASFFLFAVITFLLAATPFLMASESGIDAISSITEYNLPTETGTPWSITRGPDGAMWYTKSARTIGKVTPSGQVSEYTCPYTGGSPSDITTGPDGNLWFCEDSFERGTGQRIGRVTPAGKVTMFGGLGANPDLRSITSGPDGALWFTDVAARKIGRITTAGAVTLYGCGSGDWPNDIVSGPDGALWFINQRKIVRITTSGALKEFAIPDVSYAYGLCVGPDGAEWFTAAGYNAESPDRSPGYIGRMTTSGEFSFFPIGYYGGTLGRITSGPDGALWFTEEKYDSGRMIEKNIGRMTVTGGYSEYRTPGPWSNYDIAVGPGGTIWTMEVMPEGYGIAARIQLDPVIPDPSRWKSKNYFAEGWTGKDFQEYVCIQNPNEAPANVWLTYMTSQGVTDTQRLQILPTSRLSVDINELVGSDKEVSLRIVSTSSNIVCERPIYFNYQGKWTGGHDVMGVSEPGRVFYFAEGTSRPGFDQYYCLMNPGDMPAEVLVTYMIDDRHQARQGGVVKPHSRMTFRAIDALTPPPMPGPDPEIEIPACDFGAKVECTNGQDIVCERPIYFDYNGQWTGGHDVTGLAEPASKFYFSEGTCRPGYDTYFCILNPGDSPADVRIDYVNGMNEKKSQTLKLERGTRATVKAWDVLGRGDGIAYDFSTAVTCTNGAKIVCERPMYFNYRDNWTGGHDVIGATGLAHRFYFAEGTSRAGIDEYLCVHNPESDPICLKIVYMFTDGSKLEQHQDIEGRSTIDVRLVMANAGKLNNDFSLWVEDILGHEFLIERSMYFDFKGWTGGHDIIGCSPPIGNI